MGEVIAYLVDRRFACVGGSGKLWELWENLDHKKAWDVGCDKIGRRTFSRFSAFGRSVRQTEYSYCVALSGDKLIDNPLDKIPSAPSTGSLPSLPFTSIHLRSLSRLWDSTNY
jgi:hypothetical protein